MEDSDNLYLIRSDFIKHGERKTPNNHTSQTLINNRILIGISADSRKCLIDTLHEYKVQVFALARVPLAGFG